MYAVAIAGCVLLLTSASAFAQNEPQSPPADAAPIDVETLPVSLGRIRLMLSAPDAGAPALKIADTIEVVGVAPPVELWTAAEAATLVSGPSPFGPPTQKEILGVITPQEFKRYPIDLNALMRWLVENVGTSAPSPAPARTKTK